MIPALIIASPLILWALFLAYTALLAQWHALPLTTRILGGIIVLVAFALDVAINWSFGLLLGPTPDWTLSQKCGRLKRSDDWRAPVACWICRTLLDPFEVGGHCK